MVFVIYFKKCLISIQTCGASKAAVQTGALRPPDDRRGVEGPWCAAEPGLDSLHDPQTRSGNTQC